MDYTLLIMAAGMGSRFGGLKQIEPVGPNDEFIIDYSVYDAVKAGFTKVVFIIKRENEQIFKETIGSRVEGKIKVEYVFQDMDNLPEGYEVPEGREKPWGTAHAILCAKDTIKEPFAIINADDFYGRDAYMVMIKALKENIDKNRCVIVGYEAGNTLSENGSVKRAICEMENGKLTKLVESKIWEENDMIKVEPLNGSEPFMVTKDTLVSMNMLGFDSSIFDTLERKFPIFLNENIENLKSEYLIPEVVTEESEKGNLEVDVLKTNAKWYGVTYREDKEGVVSKLKEMTENGIYPSPLWKK